MIGSRIASGAVAGFWPAHLSGFKAGASLLGIIALAVIAFAASGRAAHAETNGSKPPLNVVVTVAMIGDAVTRIAGDRAAVTTLMGEGVDPHAYRQTRSDVVTLGRADLIFANGLYLEAQLESLLLKLAERKPVVFVGDGLSRDKLLSHDTYGNKFDPHIWMDPELWSSAIERVRDALIAADPQGRAIFEANAATYRAELAVLSSYARTVLASVPAERKILITAHDAFNYFGRAYGFEVIGIQGISTESETGLQQIERLVGLIVERQVPAVFVESSVSARNVKALIEGAAARGSGVEIGGLLYSDSMGRSGTYEGTYIGMIDNNVTRIARALGGQAPERGANGRLYVGG